MTKYEKPKLLQLKVTLLDIKPQIWRRLLVRSDTTLQQLHSILQAAMGWYDCHLHTFKIGDAEYSIPNPEWDMRDERKVTLTGPRFAARRKFLYTYDMGDGWQHEILVEAVREAERARPRRAVCLAGARSCPPEDVGGPGGYEYCLKAIRDPTHEEHQERLTWVGEGFDPEAFDVAEANEALKRPISPQSSIEG